MKIVNLTPHKLTILLPAGVDIQIPSSGEVRLSSRRKRVGYINGIKIYKRRNLFVNNLPLPKRDTIYIVSRTVAEAMWIQGREDIYAPSGHVFNKQGYCLGCRSLDANPYKFKGDEHDEERLERVRKHSIREEIFNYEGESI